MLIAESSIGFYQVSINPNAPSWDLGKVAPLFGAKMASILHRMDSCEVIYFGY